MIPHWTVRKGVIDEFFNKIDFHTVDISDHPKFYYLINIDYSASFFPPAPGHAPKTTQTVRRSVYKRHASYFMCASFDLRIGQAEPSYIQGRKTIPALKNNDPFSSLRIETTLEE